MKFLEISINQFIYQKNVFVFLLTDALIFFGMLLLTESGSQTDPRKGRIMSIVGLALLAIFFSFLLSVFRSKAQGYPYR